MRDFFNTVATIWCPYLATAHIKVIQAPGSINLILKHTIGFWRSFAALKKTLHLDWSGWNISRPSNTFPLPSDTLLKPFDTFLRPSDTFPRPSNPLLRPGKKLWIRLREAGAYLGYEGVKCGSRIFKTRRKYCKDGWAREQESDERRGKRKHQKESGTSGAPQSTGCRVNNHPGMLGESHPRSVELNI